MKYVTLLLSISICFLLSMPSLQSISMMHQDPFDQYVNTIPDSSMMSLDTTSSETLDFFDFLFDLIARRMLRWPDYPGRDEFFDGELLSDFDSVMKGAATADFDADGDVDIAVSYYTGVASSKITILYNEGDGVSFTQDDVFTHYPPNEESSSIIQDLDAEDYNNDGSVDLFYTYSEIYGAFKVNGTGYIVFNDGSGGFTEKKRVFWHGMNDTDPNPINPQITSADFDDDGDVDVMIGDNSGSLWFYKNNGNGNFSLDQQIQPGGEISWGVAAADFDNDGDIDIAYSNTDEEIQYKIHIRFNDGTSSCFNHNDDREISSVSLFRQSFWGGPSPAGCCLTTIDYNNDDNMDLLCGQGDFYSLLIQQPDGSFEPFTAGRLPGIIDYDEPGVWYSEDIRNGAIAAGDFDNDGIDDAVVGAKSAGDIYFLHNRFMLADVVPPLDFGGMINDGIYNDNIGLLIGVMCYHPLSKGTTIVFGDLPVTVKPLQPLSKVEYYRDGRLMHTDEEEPFLWLYDQWNCGRHVIDVVGYDLAGNPGGSDECIIWKFG